MFLLCFTDYPPKTATGTIVIQIEDKNDHCPILVTPKTTVCTDAKYINVTVEDRDRHPNAGPFTFMVIDEPEKMSDKWEIGQIDGKCESCHIYRDWSSSEATDFKRTELVAWFHIMLSSHVVRLVLA